MEKEFELVITIVKKGQSDKVVEASRQGGAKGGTIIFGRGTSIHESDSILGLNIQPEKEIIFTLVESKQKNDIIKLICDKANLNTAGEGLCFSMPVNKIAGSKKLMNFIEYKADKKIE